MSSKPLISQLHRVLDPQPANYTPNPVHYFQKRCHWCHCFANYTGATCETNTGKCRTSCPTCPITQNLLYKTGGKPGKPPSNYTPRLLQKYIISKVKLGSPVVCNSLKPNIHAASQLFRYVSAGSTYCHFDPFSATPPPLELHLTVSQKTF